MGILVSPGPGDYYNVHNYHYRPAHNYYLNNLRMAQRRGPMNLANRDVAGAFRTVNRDQFVNGSAAGLGRLAQLENVDRPWVNGRMAADSLDIRPTAQSIAPAPDRAASVPTHSGGRLPAVIRTEPALARGGGTDRFVRISGAPCIPQCAGDRVPDGPRGWGSERRGDGQVGGRIHFRGKRPAAKRPVFILTRPGQRFRPDGPHGARDVRRERLRSV